MVYSWEKFRRRLFGWFNGMYSWENPRFNGNLIGFNGVLIVI
jgi:hypothetical protein